MRGTRSIFWGSFLSIFLHTGCGIWNFWRWTHCTPSTTAAPEMAHLTLLDSLLGTVTQTGHTLRCHLLYKQRMCRARLAPAPQDPIPWLISWSTAAGAVPKDLCCLLSSCAKFYQSFHTQVIYITLLNNVLPHNAFTTKDSPGWKKSLRIWIFFLEV